jgi:hypothetical protein
MLPCYFLRWIVVVMCCKYSNIDLFAGSPLLALKLTAQWCTHMLDGLLAWTAHSEYLQVWVGPSWSSIALRYDGDSSGA